MTLNSLIGSRPPWRRRPRPVEGSPGVRPSPLYEVCSAPRAPRWLALPALLDRSLSTLPSYVESCSRRQALSGYSLGDAAVWRGADQENSFSLTFWRVA